MIGELDLCNRCLVQLNASIVPVAIKDDIRRPFEGGYIKDLADWAREQLSSGLHIQVGQSDRCFDPVSTWHGDPVCEVHLFWLIDRDLRSYRR